MHLTHRELWTALHGIIFGGGFLVAFSAVFFGLWSLRAKSLTPEGAVRHLRMVAVGSGFIAIMAWLAVIIGTFVIYPWYRAKPPANTSPAMLAQYPKFLLISKPSTANWHEFGMEWKEHLAWFAPILATAVAFVVTRYGRVILRDAHLQGALLRLLGIAFFCAGVAGLLGALINKAAPTR